MSARVRSKSRGKGDGKKSSKLDEPGVAKQPGKKIPQKKEPPTEDPDIEPGQEREEGACGVQEPELEAESQEKEKGLEKTGGERGDGPDVKGKTTPDLAFAKVQEAGDGDSHKLKRREAEATHTVCYIDNLA